MHSASTSQGRDSQGHDRPWYGAAWKIAAFACYAGLNAIAHYLSGGAETQLQTHLPVYVIVFFQDLFGLLLLLPLIIKSIRLKPIPEHPFLHLFRVINSAVAIIMWYFALVYMPLAQAVALSIVGPIMGVIGAKLFLKEKLGWRRGLIILLSLGLACVFIKPATAFLANKTNVKGLTFLILAALFFAIAKLATRKLAQLGETPQSLTAYLFLFIVPVSLFPAAANWVTPQLVHWPWLLLAGGLTALAIYCVSAALAYAEVSFLAPFDLCQFFFNTFIGYLAFMELPAPWVLWTVLAFACFSLTIRKRNTHPTP